jgi:hypothetical protein
MARRHREAEGAPVDIDLEVIDVDDWPDPQRPRDVPSFDEWALDDEVGRNPAAPSARAARSTHGARRARRPVVLVVALVVALAAGGTVGGVLAAKRHHGEPAAVALRVPDGPAVNDGSLPSTGRSPGRLGPTVRALGTGPFVVAGRDGVVLVDPKHATVHRIERAVDNPSVVDRNGDLVLVTDGVRRLIVDVTGRRDTIALARVDVFSALERNRFWVSSGHTIQFQHGEPAFTVPNGHHAIAAVHDGFLLRDEFGGLSIWSATSGSLTPVPGRVPHVVAVRADRVAWIADDCGSIRCNVHLTDVATGTTASLPLPFPAGDDRNATRDIVGRFSPDGRALAFVAPNHNSASLAVAIYDLVDGKTVGPVRLFGALVGNETADGTGRPLPFDWEPDGRGLVAIEPGDTHRAVRVLHFDVRSQVRSLSGDALPMTSSIVSVGTRPSSVAAPLLPGAGPLAGEPSGVTIVSMVSSTTVERLDVDTGAVEVLRLPGDTAPDVDGSQTPPNWLGAQPTMTPLQAGTVVSNGTNAWWLPRTGPPVALGEAAYTIGGDRLHAWLVRREPGDTVIQVPVDGVTGETGAPILGHLAPADATSGGFLEPIAGSNRFVVYDPHTGSRTPITGFARGGNVVAAAGDTVVWAPRCSDPDPRACDDVALHVANLRAHTTTVLHGSAADISLSPDGDELVYTPARGANARRARLFDVATATSRLLPLGTPSGTIVWGPRGWLFFPTAAGFAAWHEGWDRARVLPGVYVDRTGATVNAL